MTIPLDTLLEQIDKVQNSVLHLGNNDLNNETSPNQFSNSFLNSIGFEDSNEANQLLDKEDFLKYSKEVKRMVQQNYECFQNKYDYNEYKSPEELPICQPLFLRQLYTLKKSGMDSNGKKHADRKDKKLSSLIYPDPIGPVDKVPQRKMSLFKQSSAPKKFIKIDIDLAPRITPFFRQGEHIVVTKLDTVDQDMKLPVKQELRLPGYFSPKNAGSSKEGAIIGEIDEDTNHHVKDSATLSKDSQIKPSNSSDNNAPLAGLLESSSISSDEPDSEEEGLDLLSSRYSKLVSDHRPTKLSLEKGVLERTSIINHPLRIDTCSRGKFQPIFSELG